jgi:hypothetical protein
MKYTLFATVLALATIALALEVFLDPQGWSEVRK